MNKRPWFEKEWGHGRTGGRNGNDRNTELMYDFPKI